MSDMRNLANCIRALSADAVERANSGHPGMPMGMADAAAVLFTRHLKFDASAPDWPDRDRFVLSNGHGSLLLYSVLHLAGYADMTMDQLRNFRQLGSITAGHPEHGHAKGIEVTTGPLGQGLACAVGMAAAERQLAAEFGSDIVNHRTWVYAGDGCLMEGVGQEAVSLAGHLGLEKLIVVFDDNDISIDGDIALARSEDVKAKMAACGWRVLVADGHDEGSIDKAYAAAVEANGQPVFLAMKTVIGFGAPNKQGTGGVHGAPLGADELAAAKKQLGWEHPPFEIPDDLLSAWREAGIRGKEEREQWEGRLAQLDDGRRAEFERRLAGRLPEGFEAKARRHSAKLVNAPAKIATRKASQLALEFLRGELPELVGGSADLTGSNLTLVDGMTKFSRDAPGAYFHFGVREFAMCAACNGMALHGGLIPYGGTFLVFSDYARNAIRMAALMNIRVVFVMTHDSIGLGEDGPTHQPVEHLASLRAIPNLRVFRPADQVEAFECWELAVQAGAGPSLLALSRQGVAQLRNEVLDTSPSARGAYVLKEASGERALTILATGTEVQVALEAATKLDEQGCATAVVSMPCWELFDKQDGSYRNEVLGTAPRLAIEAAGKFGWTRYVESEDDVVGMDGFGASAPAPAIYAHLGITSETLVRLGLAKNS